MPGIRFDKDYQPEQLTRLTTGVVALVDGILKGQGEIAWDETGSRSSGTFSTDDMDFAAAFGPVEGLSTTLHFTDLLGLATAPGQDAKVDLDPGRNRRARRQHPLPAAPRPPGEGRERPLALLPAAS